MPKVLASAPFDNPLPYCCGYIICKTRQIFQTKSNKTSFAFYVAGYDNIVLTLSRGACSTAGKGGFLCIL